jgi:hypothetical protein
MKPECITFSFFDSHTEKCLLKIASEQDREESGTNQNGTKKILQQGTGV